MLLLIPYPVINPILVNIGPLPIRWYALAYIVGIISGWAYVRHLVGKDSLWGNGGAPKPGEHRRSRRLCRASASFSAAASAMCSSIICRSISPIRSRFSPSGRAACRFTAASSAPCSASSCFARRAACRFCGSMDVDGAVVPIGLALGRLANFIKPELWGRPTDVPWAMIFPGADGRRAIQASSMKRRSKAWSCSSF